jgi:hypothetical protein
LTLSLRRSKRNSQLGSRIHLIKRPRRLRETLGHVRRSYRTQFGLRIRNASELKDNRPTSRRGIAPRLTLDTWHKLSGQQRVIGYGRTQLGGQTRRQ